jgi:hypothetical protein
MKKKIYDVLNHNTDINQFVGDTFHLERFKR